MSDKKKAVFGIKREKKNLPFGTMPLFRFSLFYSIFSLYFRANAPTTAR